MCQGPPNWFRFVHVPLSPLLKPFVPGSPRREDLCKRKKTKKEEKRMLLYIAKIIDYTDSFTVLKECQFTCLSNMIFIQYFLLVVCHCFLPLQIHARNVFCLYQQNIYKLQSLLLFRHTVIAFCTDSNVIYLCKDYMLKHCWYILFCHLTQW